MNDAWVWTYDGYVPEQEGLRESLCTLGNGYFATRAALPEFSADGTHYPGTYVAGLFNRLRTEVSGRSVENESMVNVPNWLVLTCTADDGTPFDAEHCEVLDHGLELDIRRSLLTRRSRLRHPDGRVLSLTQRRFVSLRDPHLAGLETSIVAENWSGSLRVRSGLDGGVSNAGVARYRDLDNDHLEPVIQCEAAPHAVCLEVETNDSHIRIDQSARTQLFRDGEPLEVDREFLATSTSAAHEFVLEMAEGEETVVEKILALFTSRDPGIYEPHRESENWAVNIAGRFDTLLERHVITWRHAWDRSRIDVEGLELGLARILNLHLLHLLQTTSKNSAMLDVGVPARGLHGEAYRGHIFWDELFIFPFLNWRVPELARALLIYRAKRLDQARFAAFEAGYGGAMYPWQSASSGREETQTMHLNPSSGRWLPDASHRQRHVNIAVAYNIWAYWQVTQDLEFMRFWGAEMLLEIARFWSSVATYNHSLARYEIKGVMGPDEYHDRYPDSDEPGLDNNAYTNVMAVWCIERAFEILELLPPFRTRELREKLDLGGEELDRWGDISRKMRLCFHDDNILSQFEHYGDLEDFDWDGYTATHGNIQRLDRILEAEGDSTNRYKVAKQPDVLMLFYLLSAEELAGLFERLGRHLDPDFIRRNVEYYHERTAHGSTLSQMIHAWVFSRLDRDRSWSLLRSSLVSDVEDAQGGTTAEGIHLGAMAGAVDLIQRCYTGIETRGDRLFLNPSLPTEMDSISFPIRYRGQLLDLRVTQSKTTAHVREDGHRPVFLDVNGDVHELRSGDFLEVVH
jgi:alpha,alpha-trehalase